MNPAELARGLGSGSYDVHAHAAALYVAMLKAGAIDEATEFAEWYLETFDHDLED